MSEMSMMQAQSNRIVIDLDADASARLLEQAVRCRATLVLNVHSQGDAGQITGRLAGASGEVLQFTAMTAPELLPSAYADAALELYGHEYLFSTSILSSRCGEHGADIELARPAILQTWQRRRFVRAEVADSTTAEVRGAEADGAAAAKGPVLNVSPDGMAFRLDSRAADVFAVHSAVRVEFTLPAGNQRYSLAAQIKTKTPGGTPGTTIVGVHFTNEVSNAAQLRTLTGALDACV